MKYLVILLAMAFVFCIAVLLAYLRTRDRVENARRLNALFEVQQNAELAARRSRQKKDGVTLRRLEKLADELYVADIALRPEEFITIWVVCGAVVPTLALFLGVQSTVALGIAILGCAAPIAFVKFKKNKRLTAFGLQLSDALQIITNSLRAGLSFQTAMQNIATEMEEPISKEFGRVYRETQLGMPLETSLQRLVQRTANADMELVSSAVIIQRQIGGNLAQIIDNIADTINARIQLRGELKAMTASGTMSGYVIGALPVFMLVMLMFINPGYVNVFFETSAGRIMIAISVALEVTGFAIVRKIVNIKM